MYSHMKGMNVGSVGSSNKRKNKNRNEAFGVVYLCQINVLVSIFCFTVQILVKIFGKLSLLIKLYHNLILG